MILLPLPDNLNGSQLAAELVDAGYVIPEGGVVVVDGQVRIHGTTAAGNPIDGRSRSAIAQLLDVHEPQVNERRKAANDARERLRVLSAKGWGNLSQKEREEIPKLALDVLGRR